MVVREVESALPALRDVLSPVRKVDDELRDHFREERVRWDGVHPALGGFVDDLERFVLDGGKRFRPALLHWSFVASGGNPLDRAHHRIGAAIELLHAFALIHDDVMDGSEQRRSQPSVHARWCDRHQRARGRGESRRYGEGMAILAGDLAFVYADRLLGDSSPAVRRIWDDLRVEVTMGQHLDLLGAAKPEVDPSDAELTALLKTATYSVERPVELGATLAGAGPATVRALKSFGRLIGTAFQYRDDLLGAFGDPEVTGKPVGDDLRQGKPTVLLAHAMQRADEADRAVLQRVGHPELTEEDIARMQGAMRRCGAVLAVEHTVDRLRDRAIEELSAGNLTRPGRAGLVVLADLLVDRVR